MSYTKAILYGDFLETYFYERDPIISRGERGGNKGRNGNSAVAHDVVNQESSELPKTRREDSARRTELAFRRVLLANLDGVERPVLVTVTYAELKTDLRSARKDFFNFQRRCKRVWGRFEYVVVPEFQKRGAVHFHALCWGIPESVVRYERSTRMVASLWGHGFVDLVQTDGDQKLAFYLTKYLAKAHLDPRLSSVCGYSCSKGITRPQVVTHVQEWALLQELDLSTGDLLRQREFETTMMGKGRFRLYKKQQPHASNTNIKAGDQS